MFESLVGTRPGRMVLAEAERLLLDVRDNRARTRAVAGDSAAVSGGCAGRATSAMTGRSGIWKRVLRRRATDTTSSRDATTTTASAPLAAASTADSNEASDT